MPRLSLIRAIGLLAIILWTTSASAANEARVLIDTDGSAISIEFVERKPGEWVITKLDARAK